MASRAGDPLGHAWLSSFGTSPVLRRHRDRLLARRRGVVVDLRGPGGVANLAARPDGSVDTVVSLLALCSVPDLDATLAGVVRVLRPGGHLLFLEHVPTWPGSRSPYDLVGPAWRRLGGGCDPTRDVPEAVRRSGLVLGDIERFTVATVALPLRSCAAGIAYRPDDEEPT